MKIYWSPPSLVTSTARDQLAVWGRLGRCVVPAFYYFNAPTSRLLLSTISKTFFRILDRCYVLHCSMSSQGCSEMLGVRIYFALETFLPLTFVWKGFDWKFWDSLYLSLCSFFLTKVLKDRNQADKVKLENKDTLKFVLGQYACIFIYFFLNFSSDRPLQQSFACFTNKGFVM